MLPQCSHITRKRGVYYYRRRLPAPGLGEVAVSLQTRHFRCAEYLAGLLDPVFARACAMSVVKSDIAAILRQHLQSQLDADLRQHMDRKPGRGVYSPMLDDGDDPFAPDRDFIDERLHEAILARAGRDTDSVAGDVDALMTTHSLPEDRRLELAYGVLQTDVQFWQEARRRLAGLAEPIDLMPPTAVPIALAAPAGAPPAPVGPTMSELLPAFVENMIGLKEWRGQASKQNQATYRMFLEWCGDRPVQAYGKADVASFRDMLRHLPPNWSRSPTLRDTPLKEIIAQAKAAGSEGLAKKTIKRHFSALGRFVDDCIERGFHDGPNLFHGQKWKNVGRAGMKRTMWEGEELAKLFDSPIWNGRHSRFRSKPGPNIIRDSYFWLPILGLYHGNRLEEFAQLRRQDVKQIAGIWVLHITDESGGQVKNDQSKRLVPLHPEMQRLGFIEYVTETAPDPASLVFPDLRPNGPDNKLSHDWSGEFTRYRQDIGVYRKGLDYHSFRHGVTTKLYEAGVSDGLVDDLTGHEGEGESRKTYNKRVVARPQRPDQAVKALYEAICKVEWPEVDLSRLYVRSDGGQKDAG